MKNMIIVADDFCPQIDVVKATAFESGFGTWTPNPGVVGSSISEGMNFWGAHSHMLRSLGDIMGVRVLPNTLFFRITKPDTERAYVHSDRMTGDFTCIVYMSDHDEVSGTGFYRHRSSGLREMPTFQEMEKAGTMETFKEQMVSNKDEDWEQLDFVRGIYNRALIFSAPLFHSRFPTEGLGDGTDKEGRMVWTCHFCLQ